MRVLRRSLAWPRVASLVSVVGLLLVAPALALFLGGEARAANTVIASDSFNRTVSGGWGSADTGGPWTVLDSAASWSVAPGTGSIAVTATGQRRAVLGSVSAQDVDLLAKLTLPRCTGTGHLCDAFLLGRVSAGSNPTYYRVGVVQGTGSDILLRAQRSDGTNVGSDLDTGIPAADGTQVMLRVEFQGINPTVIRARAWTAGTTEPSSWLLNTTDNASAEQISGAIGVRVRNEDTAQAHSFALQSYQATALAASSPPSISGFSPTSGAVGSSVTISGSNLTGASAVKFGGTSASVFTVNSDTQITATVPAGASSGPISVTTPNGTGASTGTFTVGTASILASDSFNRTVSGGWGTADVGGPWTVLDTKADWSVSPGTGSVISVGGTTATQRALLGNVNVQDVDVLTKVTMPFCTDTTAGAHCDAFVLGRVTGGGANAYKVGVFQGAGAPNGDIWLRAQRSDNSVFITKDVDTGIPGADGAQVMLRVEFQGVNPTVVRAKAWLAGTTEPSAWGLNATDSNSAEQTAGSIGLRLKNEDASGSETFGFQSFQATALGSSPAPSISGFSPTSGAVGSSVTISGSHFTGATGVSFGGTDASVFTVNSDAQITATVPSGASSGPISVTTPNGTATSASSFTVSSGSAPSISGFSPSSGAVGSSVAISGSHFTGATGVSFGGTGASVFTVNSDAQITATVPSGASSGAISVTTPNGTATSASSFTVSTGSVVASDSFNRTVSGGWGTAAVGGPWTVLDTSANWSVSSGTGSVNVAAAGTQRALLSTVKVQDVDVLAKITLPVCTGSTNCDAFVLGRATTNGQTSYRVGIVEGAGRSDIYLRTERSDGTTLASDVDLGIPASAGAQVMLRVEFQGVNPTVIRARAWSAGTPEPSTWLVNTTDGNSAEQISGAIGVRLRNEDTGQAHTFGFQSYQATALPALPPPTTIASDNFQRTVSSGWGTAGTGGWWTVVGSPWNWSTTQGAGQVTVGAGSTERAYLSSFTVQDTDVVEQATLPMCGSNTCDSFVLGRYTAAYSPTYYRVGVVQGPGNGDILLRAQRSDGTALASDIDTGIPASSGAQVMLHVQFQGVNPTVIRARAWPVGTSEPSAWQLNTTDGNAAEQRGGMVGVQTQNEDTTAAHTFKVSSLQATGSANPVSVAPNPAGTAHYLYVVDDGRIFVYDIDNNHALVKQIPIPEQGKRGLTIAPNQGMLYVSECGPVYCRGSHGSLVAYDLVHDDVAWIANYSFGVDQQAITPDGSTIYMPHGDDGTDGLTSILNASNGKPIGTINTGTNGHNTIASLDGSKIYQTGLNGTNFNYAHVIDTTTNQVTMNAGPTVNGIRPFTVNGKNTMMFTTSSFTCGFQVLSLVTGNVLYTVPFSGSCNWTASSAPSHGISLSPDENRVYIMNAPQDVLEVYDVSGLPASAPTFIAALPLSSVAGNEIGCQNLCTKEGWVLNDLSGHYVYVGDTGDVVSTSTLQIVDNLPALDNSRVFAEIDWQNGTPSTTSTRFGLGRVTN